MHFWEMSVRFFSLADANVRWVLLGSVLLGGAAGGLGTFVYLQKRSLVGDALSHAALPGVALAFLLVGRKEFVALLAGAAITGWLGALAVDYIVTNTRLKLDAALGIVLTTFFGLGIVLLTHIQKSGSGAQSGLDKFLFGQAAAMGRTDILTLSIVAVVLLVVMTAGFNKFKILIFDLAFAKSLGLPVTWLQFLLTSMVVLAVTIGLQAVGVVLMAAMLITPAAAARQWTDRLALMIALASLFGIISGIAGAYISFLAPRFPTGPWMVVTISFIFACSLLFAPRRGLLSRMRRHWSGRNQITRDHILKVLFRSGQERGRFDEYFPQKEILSMWSFTAHELSRGLKQLLRQGRLQRSGRMYRLSESGVVEGAAIIRRHRLWEVYLSRYLALPYDHLHRDAEEMEHLITPDMEAELEDVLQRPLLDPHHKEIPRITTGGNRDT